MSGADPLQALVLPFEKGLLPPPDRAFLMRAEDSPAFDAAWRAALVCEQGFKPARDSLSRAGLATVARLSGRFETGLCRLTRHKAESRALIARAWSLLAPGGVLVCAGANTEGAASLERETDRAFGLDGQMSKHQCRVFWLRRGDHPPTALADWLAAGQPRPVADSGFVARAGCFSPDHVDPASRLLADCVPETVAGRVADLGAGWGYLSVRLLQDRPAVTAVDLFEAEDAALEDCRANLDRLVPDRAGLATLHWHDVRAGLPETAPYDWIVSNPPFHDGRAADPAIGQDFIRAAWKAIRRQGKFLLVANTHLPYEAELRRRFRKVDLLKAEAGFKLYQSSDRIDRR